MTTDTERLARAAQDLLAAASEPIAFPQSPGSDALALVPASYLEFLRTALDGCTRIDAPQEGG